MWAAVGAYERNSATARASSIEDEAPRGGVGDHGVCGVADQDDLAALARLAIQGLGCGDLPLLAFFDAVEHAPEGRAR